MQNFLEEIYRNNILKEQYLSEFACKSEEAIRIHENKSPDIRSEFFRDVDRIIHSKTYARYIDKTQVYPFVKNDHITHRVLHVQLVAKIARTIGRALLLNEDLIEAIALGHDVGHAPFGHKGEDFLNNICVKNNIGLFRHNAQSVKLLHQLENSNLTIQTLDGILAHNGEILLNHYEPDKTKTKGKILDELDKCFKIPNFSKSIVPMTLEACVVRVCDVIAYIGRDIEDAIIVGSIKRDDLPEDVVKLLGNTNAEIVNRLVLDVIENSWNKPYICFSQEVFDCLIKLKEFNFKYIYSSPEAEKNMGILEELFYKLFDIYLNKLNSGLNNDEDIFEFVLDKGEGYLKNIDSKRIVIDYIAGQTDKYFLRNCEEYIPGFKSEEL